MGQGQRVRVGRVHGRARHGGRGCRGLGMVPVLVDPQRVLGVEGFAALVTRARHVDVELHVAAHVAEVVRLAAADGAAPERPHGVLVAAFDDQAGDLIAEAVVGERDNTVHHAPNRGHQVLVHIVHAHIVQG